MVLHCIFIKKPVDVCKKLPPPYGAKNQHVNITKDVCKKSPPEILGSVRGRRLFAHVYCFFNENAMQHHPNGTSKTPNRQY